MQLLITGMHRSGTSVFARMLSECGCYFGRPEDLMSPKPDNPDGFLEHLEAFDINVGILDAAGVAWDTSVGGEVDQLQQTDRSNAGARIHEFVAEMMSHEAWAVKDPRLAMTFPLWRPLLAEPIIVWCVRNPIEIGMSLKGRNGFPTDLGISLWEAYTIEALRVFAETPVVIASFDDLLRDPVTEVKRLVNSVNEFGRGTIEIPDDSAIQSVVRKGLHRSVVSPEQEAQFLTEPRRRLWELSQNAESWSGQADVPDLSQLSREEILHHRHMVKLDRQTMSISGTDVGERLAGIETGLNERWAVVNDGLKELSDRYDVINSNERWTVIDDGLKGLSRRCDLILEVAEARLGESNTELAKLKTRVDEISAVTARELSSMETRFLAEFDSRVNQILSDRDEREDLKSQLAWLLHEREDTAARLRYVTTELERHQAALAGYRSSVGGRFLERWWRLRSKG